MEMSEVITLISTVGFPITMCVMFFYWFTGHYKTEQENTRECVEGLKDTVNELKTTIGLLTEIIKREEK